MESCDNRSLDDIENCNSKDHIADSFYSTDSSVENKDLKINPCLKEIHLIDKTNGTIGLHCTIQDVESAINKTDSDVVNSGLQSESALNSHDSDKSINEIKNSTEKASKREVSEFDVVESVNCATTLLSNVKKSPLESSETIENHSSGDNLHYASKYNKEDAEASLPSESELSSSNLCLNQTIACDSVDAKESRQCTDTQNNSENCHKINLSDNTVKSPKVEENVNNLMIVNSVSLDAEVYNENCAETKLPQPLCNEQVEGESICNKITAEVTDTIDSTEQNNAVSNSDESDKKKEKGSDDQCFMQTVVGGTLQPLDIHSLGDENASRTDTLFAGVPEELKVLNDRNEVEAIVIPDSTTLLGELTIDTVHLTNLTEPPPVQIESSIEVAQDESHIQSNYDIKLNNKIGNEIDQPIDLIDTSEPLEGKPALIKILPIKNGHDLWNIEELKLLLDDKGSVLLRLCAAPEAGNEDIIEGPQADFTALLLDENVHSFELNDGPEPDEYLRNVHPLYGDKYHDFPPYEELPPFWRFAEPRIQSTPKRKYTSSSGPQRGRKRGRPPLHNRPYIPKSKILPPALPDEPIKFRPPTPPPVLLSDNSKSLGILEAALSKSIDVGSRKVATPSISNVKKTSPVISNKQLPTPTIKSPSESETVNDNDDDDDLTSVVSEDIGEPFTPKGMTRPKRFLIKIPCPHCPLQFRKKSALTGHIRLRHKMLRKCPICQESIKVKGKFGIKFHILKAHKNENAYKCENCDESFKLSLHLKNHKKLIHGISGGSSDEEREDLSENEETSAASQKGVKQQIKRKIGMKILSDESESEDEEEKNPEVPQPVPKKSKIIIDEDSNSVKSEPTRTLRSKMSSTTSTEKKEKAASVHDSSSSESGNESDDEGAGSDSDSEVEEKKNYFCDQCDVGFSHVFKLRHHKKEHSLHPLKAKKEGCNKEEFRCKECDKQCRSNYQLRLHTMQHSKAATNKPSIMRTRASIINSKEQESSKNKSLNDRLAAVKTKKEESEDEPQDDFQGQQQRSSGDNEIPEYIERRGRMYYCTKCNNQSFKREKQMVYHLKKIHEALYPFRKCPHCPRVYRSSGPFTRHLSQHNGRRCPVEGCKAKYKVLRLIKKHQRHAHPHLPHRCQRCIQLYKKESELEEHMKNVHCGKKRKNKAGDDEDDDEEEEEEEEEEGDEEEEEEEEEDEKEREKEEQKKKQQQLRKGKQKERTRLSKSKKSGSKKERDDEGSDASSSVRRSRSNVSYREDEDDEDFNNTLASSILPAPSRRPNVSKPNVSSFSKPNVSSFSKPNVSSFSKPNVPSFSKPNVSTFTKPNISTFTKPSSSIKEPPKVQPEAKKASILAQSNPLKNLREAILMQSASKAKQQQPQAKVNNNGTSKVPPPIVKPKRSYVRRAPYKKRKVDNSWTAALKAQYEGFSSDSNKGITMYKNPGTPMHAMSSGLQQSSHNSYSPGITADVVRRVAESLLSKHQEQQQKQQIKLQKKQMKQNKRNVKSSSYAPHGGKSTQLPRITYSTLMGSHENSMSSFDDSSCHADVNDFYGSTTHVSARSLKVPEDDDDSGPAKVLRFDSF